jgi:putative peptidoglycan lipid II flippase
MLRKVLLVMGGTLASRVLGLLRQAVFNALYPDALKDAFNVAYRVPNLLRELLAEGAVQNALIPLLKSLPPEEAQAFARRFAAFLLGVNLLVLGLGYLLAPWVAGLLVAPGSHLREGESFQQVVYLTRLLLPFLLGISMAALFSAFLQAEERFLPYALGPVAFNLVAIGLMALFPGDPTALGLSVALGGLVQALVQLPFLRGPFERLSLVLALLGGLLTGLAPYVVVLLFGLFGPLTPENRTYSALVLAALGLALLPWGVNTLFLRGLYALGKVREAVMASALVFLANTLGYWLLRDAGLFLLNLATALAGYLGLFFYLALLRREGVAVGYAPLYVLKAFLAGLLAAVPGLFLGVYFPAATPKGALLPLVLGGLGGLFLFLLAALLLGLPLKALARGREGGSRGA